MSEGPHGLKTGDICFLSTLDGGNHRAIFRGMTPGGGGCICRGATHGLPIIWPKRLTFSHAADAANARGHGHDDDAMWAEMEGEWADWSEPL